MSHKDYIQLRNRIVEKMPEIDLNGDGVPDPIVQGILPKADCDKIAGCSLVDGYAVTPKLKNRFDDPVLFSKAPAGISRLFGKATAFAFTSAIPTLRFFSDDADGSRFEKPTSFAVGQTAGYFDKAGKFISFRIDGVAIGLRKGTTSKTVYMETLKDGGQARRIAYGKTADGKSIEKALSELIWSSADGQAIDPEVLIVGSSRDRVLTKAEAKLVPLFKKAEALALQFKKLQQSEAGGPRDIRAVRLESPEIKQQAREAMETMLRENCPPEFSADHSLWDGLRIALGKVVGLKRSELVI